MGKGSYNKSLPLSSPKEEEDDEEEEEEEEESPVRAISVLKIKEDIKRFEETEDCFILDFDPSESLELSTISLEKNLDAVDLSVVAEKGPVACRDYPHARHLCLKFRFTTTAHESYCEMCYCYVCDSAAPCKYWTSTTRHCDADGADHWKYLRKAMVKY